MHRETSPTVSSIAGRLVNFRPPNLIEIIDSGDPDRLAEFCEDVRTFAASCLSQDETPGQVSRSSDIRNFQILIHSTDHSISFGFQWSNRAYNASVPHEASPSDVISALANLGIMITRYELENDHAE